MQAKAYEISRMIAAVFCIFFTYSLIPDASFAEADTGKSQGQLMFEKQIIVRERDGKVGEKEGFQRMVRSVSNHAYAKVSERRHVKAAKRYDRDNSERSDKPNLAPFRPSDWDGEIVVSDKAGTNSENTIYAGEMGYIDYAVTNNGTADTDEIFCSKLYINGIQVKRTYTEGLQQEYYSYSEDFEYTFSEPGSYTLKLVCDADNNVAESDENDNEYERDKNVPDVAGKPNLLPHNPSGWDDKIVVSDKMGTNTENTIYPGNTAYIDFACTNDGTADVSESFSIELYVNDIQVTRISDPGAPAGFFVFYEDVEYAFPQAEVYTLRLICDADNDVSESDENDNEYKRDKYIPDFDEAFDITPFRPPGWSDKIVVSGTSGTYTDSPLLTGNTAYIHFSCGPDMNDASYDDNIVEGVYINEGFYTELYINGESVIYGSFSRLYQRGYSPVENFEYIFPQAGTYNLRLVCDAHNNINESDESDNEYQRDVTILALPSNDDFANSSVLTGMSGHANGSNAFATKETDEPDHAGKSGGKSLWWTWTAPETGYFGFDTHGSDFNTLLAVYTGTDIAHLTKIARNDNDGSANRNSGLIFRAQPGIRYYIAVDGYTEASGDIILNWEEDIPLRLESAEPNYSSSGQKLETTLTGTGFDKNTRVMMYSDNIACSADTPGSAVGLAISGTTAYVADGPGGLQIADVSDLQNPELISSLEIKGSAVDVIVKGTTAYLAGQDNELHIIDVNEPENPYIISSLTLEESHGFLRGLALSDTVVYLADGSGSGLHVINVEDPDNPFIILSKELLWVSAPIEELRNIMHNEIVVTNTTAYIAYGYSYKEGDIITSSKEEGGLYLIDVMNPADPTPISYLNIPNPANGVTLSGTTALVAAQDGLQIIDVSLPSRPALISTVETPDEAWRVAVSGTNAFVTCGGSSWDGLMIVDITDIEDPQIITSIETPSGTPKEIAVSDTAVFMTAEEAGLIILPLPVEIKPVTVNSDTSLSLTLPGTEIPDSYFLCVFNGREYYKLSDAVTFEPDWTPKSGQLSMNVRGEAFINDNRIESEGYVIAAFGPAGVSDCRGTGEITQSGRKWEYDLSITSDRDGEEISFKIWNSNKSQIYNAETTIIFENDAAVSQDIDKPLKIDSVYPTLGVADQELKVTLNGTRLDEYSGISFRPDIMNKRSVTASVDTPGLAKEVAVSGSTALVADGWRGVQVIDLSTPLGPSVVASVDMPGSARGIAASGKTAYAIDEFGLQIIDISDPADAAIISSLETPGYASGIAVSDTRVYVADDMGLQIIDVSIPSNPAIIGFADTRYDADSVAVSGTIAYVTEKPGILEIIDISDAENPAIIGSVNTETYGYAYDIAVSGTTAFVAGRGLQIIDVSNPQNPYIIGPVNTAGDSYGVTVSGTTAYVASGNRGLHVINVSDPGNASIISSVELSDMSQGITVSGTTVYIAAGDSGLYVIDMNDIFSLPVGFVEMSNSVKEVGVSGATACVADYKGLKTIDMSNPANPIITGQLDIAGTVRGIEMSGAIAYMATSDGLQVADVSNPGNPVIIGTVKTPDSAHAVSISGTTAYVAAYDSGLQVIDVSDPGNPAIIGSVDTAGSAVELTVINDIVYLTTGYSTNESLQIIDVSNPVNPAIIGSLEMVNYGREIAVSDKIAYIAAGYSGLQVIDVNDPENPKIIGSVDMPDDAEGVTLSGTTAYVVSGDSGLQIIDVSKPSNPAIIGSVITPGDANGVFIEDTTAYIACSEGLQILEALPSEMEIAPERITVNSETNISVNLPAPLLSGHYTLKIFNETESYESEDAVTFVTPEESYLLDTKAVIVAGGSTGPENKIWEETKKAADYAYDALLYQGYTAESIYYLSPDHELGSDRTDGLSSAENLSYVLNTWAHEEPEAAELLLYMVDHGNKETFSISADEKIRVQELDTWLDALQTPQDDSQDPIPVIVIYDACQSGTFLPGLEPPWGAERVVITSASAENANMLVSGTLSFSWQFWDAIYKGATVGEAFSHAKGQMETYQTALLNANGNSIGNEDEDTALASGMKIRRGYRPQADVPYIYDISRAQIIYDPETSATLRASVSYVEDSSEIRRVWAIITPPDFDPGAPDNPVTDLLEAELADAGDGIYEGIYDGFDKKGRYEIKMCAVSRKGVYALFRDTVVVKSAEYIAEVRCDETVLSGTDATALLYAVSTGKTDPGIARVWAEISPWGQAAVTAEFRGPDNDNVYEGSFGDFTTEGTYNAAVYAEDTEGFVCPPAVISFIWSETGSEADRYENDDTFGEADVLEIGTSGEIRHHTFHNAGDEDWTVFYGVGGKTYTVRAGAQGPLCDPVIEILRFGNSSPEPAAELTVNEAGPGKDESADWTCPETSYYWYVKVSNADPGVFGKDVSYTLEAYLPIAADTATVRGTVTDLFGNPVAGAGILISGGGSALSRYDGSYTVSYPPGTYTLRADAEGYGRTLFPVTVTADETLTLDIVMMPVEKNIAGTPLGDALLILQLLTGETSYLHISGQPDVNGDDKIGLEEVIYLLQNVAGK
ncbi:CARDB domain-containing protein [Desulfococcaceae bacterium HSG8]|nr:CARDB domain-containing protein [Desulfococcaceae bacterium HSG8]